MISTASMIGVGKVYKNLMVDVQSTNEKLIERSKRIIVEATGVSYEVAAEHYEKAERNVKAAIVMVLLQCEYGEALEKLKEAKRVCEEGTINNREGDSIMRKEERMAKEISEQLGE